MSRPRKSSMRITEKMKRFAHCYVNERMSAADSYQDAYNATAKRHVVTQKAYELLKTPNVAALVNELRAQQAATLHVSVPSLAYELEEVREKAMEARNFTAALGAIQTKAKLFGFLDNKEASRLGDLTEDEALDILEKAGIETRRMSH